MKGYLEDPHLAFTFLGVGQEKAKDIPHFNLPIPTCVQPGRDGVNDIDIIKTCHVAVASMWVMANLEKDLKKSNLFEAFINIEM